MFLLLTTCNLQILKKRSESRDPLTFSSRFSSHKSKMHNRHSTQKTVHFTYTGRVVSLFPFLLSLLFFPRSCARHLLETGLSTRRDTSMGLDCSWSLALYQTVCHAISEYFLFRLDFSDVRLSFYQHYYLTWWGAFPFIFTWRSFASICPVLRKTSRPSSSSSFLLSLHLLLPSLRDDDPQVAFVSVAWDEIQERVM